MSEQDILEEGSLGPEDEGSMAFKLARGAEGSQGKSEEDLEAARQVEAEAAAEVVGEAAEAELDKAKPKFGTVEEYDKAYKEAETRMHSATEAAAREKEAREALETEAEAVRKELADFKAEREAAAAEAARPKALEDRKARYKKALSTIGELDDTDPDYHDKLAEAWAETGSDVPDPKEIAREAAKLAREELKAERAAETAKTAEDREAATSARIRQDAERLATEQGLDMTPGSADYDLFYVRVNELSRTPDHEYAEKPFEEQVKWATGRVREALGKKIEFTDAERAAARRNQNKNTVLERGVTRVLPVEPPRQRSMQEILEGRPAG